MEQELVMNIGHEAAAEQMNLMSAGPIWRGDFLAKFVTSCWKNDPLGELVLRFQELPGTKLLLPYSKYRQGLGARLTVKPALLVASVDLFQ